MTSIGNSAFSECTGLTSITIPNSVTSIGSGAFRKCSGLTSVTISNCVTIIGENTFSRCSNLTSITLSKNLSIIKKQAFYGCSNLESITIPASVEYIYQEAFANCSKLKEVKALPEEPPFLYANSFSNYDITLKVPESAANEYKSTEPWSNFGNIVALSEPKYVLGDVNGDDTLSVTDVGMMISFILGQNPEGFNEEAADMNGDGDITVTDVGALITKILTGE